MQLIIKETSTFQLLLTYLRSRRGILTSLWPTQRMWEKKAASVTPELHDLWFEVPQQLTYLGYFYHFMEDPMEQSTRSTG
jgi:hypothetical protein